MGFWLVNGLWITNNYSATANLHNSQITTAPAKSFPACCVFTSRSLANSELHALKSSIHRLPYRTDLLAPIVFKITPRHWPRRNTWKCLWYIRLSRSRRIVIAIYATLLYYLSSILKLYLLYFSQNNGSIPFKGHRHSLAILQSQFFSSFPHICTLAFTRGLILCPADKKILFL
jgi:hypothetical protein